MMRVDDTSPLAGEWFDLTEPLPHLSLMQIWAYGAVRAERGQLPVRGIVRDGDRAVAVFQGMVRKLPIVGGGLLWINRGPLLISDVAVEDVVATIAAWARTLRWYVRVAPPVGQLDEVRLAAGGCRSTGDTGWSSAFVDLRTESTTRRSQLDQKWRNCLNKAIRSGVEVDGSSEPEALAEYAEHLRQRIEARPFATTVTPEFLVALQRHLTATRKLTVFSARSGGAYLGGHVSARYGTSAEYLSGLLTDQGRRINAGHALMWTAMETMAGDGVERYDLGGMHPELTPSGIYHFKNGVGGVAYRYVNEVESSGDDWRSTLIRRRIATQRAAETKAAE